MFVKTFDIGIQVTYGYDNVAGKILDSSVIGNLEIVQSKVIKVT